MAPTPRKTTIDLQEFAIMCSAGFPEPYTFSLRAKRILAVNTDPEGREQYGVESSGWLSIVEIGATA